MVLTLKKRKNNPKSVGTEILINNGRMTQRQIRDQKGSVHIRGIGWVGTSTDEEHKQTVQRFKQAKKNMEGVFNPKHPKHSIAKKNGWVK